MFSKYNTREKNLKEEEKYDDVGTVERRRSGGNRLGSLGVSSARARASSVFVIVVVAASFPAAFTRVQTTRRRRIRKKETCKVFKFKQPTGYFRVSERERV